MKHAAPPSTGLGKAHPDYMAMIIFGVITFGALIGVPAFAILYGYTWLDWTMFGLLYVVTGLGITVGYHRLLAHRSFACPNWVKTGFLIAGAWALQNSVLKWAADHIRHHAHTDQEQDPYNAQQGFWYSHCGWLFFSDPCGSEIRKPLTARPSRDVATSLLPSLSPLRARSHVCDRLSP